MANQTNNFTRSNVNAATLQITDPGRSSFNLGHRNELSIPFGKIVPVSMKILLPTDTFSGSLKPNLHLEKIGTPSIGSTRLDTHNFVVNFRRINKDMRSNLENCQNFFPSFNPYHILNVNLGFLLKSDTVDSFIKQKLSTTNSFKAIAIDMFSTANNNLFIIKQNYTSYGEYCYQLDKYFYLSDYFSAQLKIIDSLTYDETDPRFLFKHALPMFFKPFIGNGSLLDYLGYPCFISYNKLVAFLDNAPLTSWASFKSALHKFIESQSLIEPYLANALHFSHTTNSDSFVADDYTVTFSELPLRAYYVIWYDYIRNWHIEERTNILDPDNFGNQPIVPTLTGEPTLENADNTHKFSQFLSLCTLRSRDYGTDFLTSIQTDDSFRHVYSPVFNFNDNNEHFNVQHLDSSNPTPSNLLGINIDNFGFVQFPSDLSNISSEDIALNATLANDLQTMRRSGMLEKWLARNYYYPDTYVGRLQARFGIRPSDYEVLVSQYIGGSESFISGQELVANMSTSESVVGSRNLKADVSTTDNFSGSVSDYSILISVISTVPIVTYDVISPAAKITDFIDFPQPEFATDTRVEARVSDFLRGFSIQPSIGYVPRYYMFRVSADETHGRFLTDYRTFNWLRDNYSMSQENFDFSLNPYSLHVNLPLNAFIGLKPWDDFAYGSCDVNLVVNRALPAAIEII